LPGTAGGFVVSITEKLRDFTISASPRERAGARRPRRLYTGATPIVLSR
jgi:hypothetical protein